MNKYQSDWDRIHLDRIISETKAINDRTQRKLDDNEKLLKVFTWLVVVLGCCVAILAFVTIKRFLP